MNRNQIWRAVAYSTGTCKGLNDYDEVHVYVDASDYQTAKSCIYERLADEWGVTRDLIEFYNLWGESELRDMALGPQTPIGAPLLEIGWGDGKARHDRDPLILVASSRLRVVLELALKELQVGVFSCCRTYLSHPCTADHD